MNCASIFFIHYSHPELTEHISWSITGVEKRSYLTSNVHPNRTKLTNKHDRNLVNVYTAYGLFPTSEILYLRT